MHKRSTVNLIVKMDSDGTQLDESVLVDELGGDRYRVVASPGLLQGFAAGDEIELAAEEPLGFRVTKRGGNLSVQFYWKGDLKRAAQELLPKVEAINGYLDGEAQWLLVFTIPMSAGFPAIEMIFYEGEKLYPGCQWLYGNV